jgi:hypothetical protein
MVIVTNLALFLVSLYCFRQLKSYGQAYSHQMGWFLFMIGIGGVFGAVAHATHYQLGHGFFNAVVFTSNLLSLISVYFCFKGSYTYYNLQRGTAPNKMVIGFVTAWISILVIITLINSTFLLIKIHAGLVLIYALAVHYMAYRKKDRGSGMIVLGILVSFLSIIVHSLKISLHEWFNHKDIAHVIMIVSMIIIYRGIRINSENLEAGSTKS